jgi:hypothetical protein
MKAPIRSPGNATTETGAPSVRMAVAVGLGSFVLLLLAMPREVNMFDEGIVLTGATRVLAGAVVHRDFYSNYGPAQFYVVAAVFRIFGESFIAARAYGVFVQAAILGMLFYIIRRACSLPLTCVFTAIAAAYFFALGNYLYTVFPCMFLALLAAQLLTHRGDEQPSPRAVFASGACTGLAALFRYEIGFFLFLANLIALTILTGRDAPSGTRVSAIRRSASTYIAGTATVFAPGAAMFLAVSPIQPFIDDIVDYSSKYYARMRGLPFPDLRTLSANPAAVAVYLPLVAVGLAALESAIAAIRGSKAAAKCETRRRATAYLIVFGCASVGLFFKGTIRVSILHMLPGIVLSLVVLAELAGRWFHGGRPLSAIAAVALLLFAAFPPEILATIEASRLIRDPDRSLVGWLAAEVPARDTGRAPSTSCAAPRMAIAEMQPQYEIVAEYLRTHTAHDERVLMALDRHDKILVNPISLYFAVGRSPGTHWYQFDPGLQTRSDIQAAIVRELQDNHVRWVVRDATYTTAAEPNGSAHSSGVRLLDRFLDQHYRPVMEAGPVAVWLAKGAVPRSVTPCSERRSS